MRKKFDKDKLFIFTGGLGSGKTEIAVNFSFELFRKKKSRVHLIDLDIIKPYYKSRHLKKKLSENDIILVAPPAPYLLADLPLLPPEVNTILSHSNGPIVVDVGGDEAGARVLRCYNEILKSSKYQFLYVINISRPLSGNTEYIIKLIDEIEKASNLKVTGIINNTHLLWETTPKVIQEGAKISRQIAKKLGIPLVFHSMKEDLEGIEHLTLKEPLFKMKLFFYPHFRL